MVEILLTVYLSSFVASWCLITWYLWTLRRNFKSTKLAYLNANLSKTGLYWANSSSSFETLSVGSIEQDYKKSLRSFLLIGLLLSLLSLLGFLLLTCVVVSLKFLAKSRLEKNVFRSELCQKDLELEKVSELVAGLKAGLVPAFALLLALIFVSPLSMADSSSLSAESSVSHTVRLYAHGPSALKAYLAMIAEAKTSIDLESFVLVPDRAGTLILQALHAKALQHVHVRLMLDAYGSKKYFTQDDLNYFLAAGVEIRFYNPSKLRMLPIDHRKFLIIDGQKVFFGGRNLSEENFGADAKKRRLDYSIEMQGPLVSSILNSFNEFWNSSMVEAVVAQGAGNFFAHPQASELKAKLDSMSLIVAGEFHPSRLVFVSDEPTNDRRLFTEALVQKLSHIESNVLIETPDFAAGRRIKSVLGKLLQDHKSVSLLTVENSDHSATLSYSVLSLGADLNVSGLKGLGASVYFKESGLSPEVLPLMDPKSEAIAWGSHCKATIFDGKDVLLGSFNYDVLSEEHNAEAGVYFLNAPDMAAALRNLEISRPYIKQ